MPIKNKIYRLLIWGQRYTQTDNIYLAQQGSHLYIGQFISLGIGFLMAMAYARFLPKQTFGEFNYLLSITAILGIASLEGMATAIVQSIARGYEGGFKKAVRTKLKWSLIGSAAGLFFGAYYFYQGNIKLSISFFIIALFLPIINSFFLYTSFLQGKRLFKPKVIYQTITKFFTALIILGVIFYTDNLLLLILAYFISNSFFNFLFHLWTIKKFKPNQQEDKRTIKYGRDLSFIDVISVIGKNIDQMIVFHFLGAPMLAIYHFAILPLDKTTTLLQNIRQLAIPKLAVLKLSQLKSVLFKKIFRLFFIIVPGLILFLLIAPFLYQLFFPQYAESANYARWLFLAILAFPFTFIASAFNAQMKKREVFKLTTISNIVYIISLLILIPLYGIWGLIASYLIKVSFNSAFAVYLFKKI